MTVSPSSLAVGEDCHSAGTPSPSLLKHLIREEGVAAEWQNSRRRPIPPVQRATVTLLHPPLPLVGASIWTERGCQHNDRTLAGG